MLVYIIALSQFASAFMFSGVAVTLPAMGAELAAGGVALGLVETLYMGAGAALLLPVGKLADATDKNTLFKVGLLLFAASSLAIGFMPSIWTIIGLRLVQGVASALMVATGIAILTDYAPLERRGQAYGNLYWSDLYGSRDGSIDRRSHHGAFRLAMGLLRQFRTAGRQLRLSEDLPKKPMAHPEYPH